MGELFEGLLVHALDGPLVHRDGPDGVVDREGRLVPVDADPFHTAAVALDSNLGQMAQDGSAVAHSTLFGDDEQLLDIEAAPTHKGGEIVEEHRKAYHALAAFLAQEQAFCRMLHKKRVVQRLLVGHKILLTLLVNGHLVNKIVDDRSLLRSGRADD